MLRRRFVSVPVNHDMTGGIGRADFCRKPSLLGHGSAFHRIILFFAAVPFSSSACG
jgi:hypothetical protein